MEFLLIIGGIWLAVVLLRRVMGERNSPETPVSSHRPTPAPSPKRTDTYRPTSHLPGKPRIVFETPRQGGPMPSGEALAGLHDAFTGAPLNPRLGLFQCTSCKVYYHADSVAVLREENGSRCVACGTAAVVALTESSTKSTTGRDYNPDVVSLANFRQHFDRVVTFEGRVHAVKVSRRGTDYAVMFENAPWTKGLKLVFFRGAVRAVGGPDFINSLSGRTVRVRGLLINHASFGPEIIISERGMILRVS
jgi:hypothetical protein